MCPIPGQPRGGRYDAGVRDDKRSAMTRHLPLALLPLLAACNAPPSENAAFTRAIAEANAQAEDDGRILCAGSGSDFARTCTVDRTQSKDGLILTVRRPDGGFHRLLAVKDGRGLVAADGAEAAKVTIVGDGQIEVAIGGDRFRLPATIKGHGKK